MARKPAVHRLDELIGVGLLRAGVREGDEVNGNVVLVQPN